MLKMKKYVCSALCFLILLTAVSYSTDLRPKAAAVTVGMVTGSGVNIRSEAIIGNNIIKTVSYITFTVISSSVVGGYTWHHITYTAADNSTVTGYIRGDNVRTATYVIGAEPGFEAGLAGFPESYQTSIRALHALYPNWLFYGEWVPKSFTDSVNDQRAPNRKQVNLTSDGVSWRSMEPGAYEWSTGQWANSNGGWTGAAREVIAYYMDPRNFLNTAEIFQFLKQSYNGAETTAGLQQIVAGTFLANGYSDPNDTAYGGSYINVIMEAARQSGVSPYVIASTIIQEQGVNGTSALISGAHGYYNFFNYGASGSTSAQVIANGIAFAQSQGWNTRSASIIGGAKRSGSNYFGVGQDTYYFMDFNVMTPASLNHQYAQSVYDARSKGAKIASAYLANPSMPLIFRIPMYTGLSAVKTASPPETAARSNYYFTNISLPGLTPSFSMFNYSYDVSVTGNTEFNVSLPTGATLASPGSYALNPGQNRIVLSVRAETGYTNDYIINVYSSVSATLHLPGQGPTEPPLPPEPTVLCGDTNGDGRISIVDLANVQKHLLGLITLTGDNFIGADTNKSGTITIVDLANIQKHLLGLITLKF